MDRPDTIKTTYATLYNHMPTVAPPCHLTPHTRVKLTYEPDADAYTVWVWCNPESSGHKGWYRISTHEPGTFETIPADDVPYDAIDV